MLTEFVIACLSYYMIMAEVKVLGGKQKTLLQIKKAALPNCAFLQFALEREIKTSELQVVVGTVEGSSNFNWFLRIPESGYARG